MWAAPCPPSRGRQSWPRTSCGASCMGRGACRLCACMWRGSPEHVQTGLPRVSEGTLPTPSALPRPLPSLKTVSGSGGFAAAQLHSAGTQLAVTPALCLGPGLPWSSNRHFSAPPHPCRTPKPPSDIHTESPSCEFGLRLHLNRSLLSLLPAPVSPKPSPLPTWSPAASPVRPPVSTLPPTIAHPVRPRTTWPWPCIPAASDRKRLPATLRESSHARSLCLVPPT